MLYATIKDNSVSGVVVFDYSDYDENYNDVIEALGEWLYDNDDYIEEKYFDDFYDECYEHIELSDCSYSPSFVLERIDPILYNMEKSAYCDWLIANAIEELKTSYTGTTVYCGNLEIIVDEE